MSDTRDLADGESTDVNGSGSKPWVVKNVGGVYSCNCPAWRNQPGVGTIRTCKHIGKVRGVAAEVIRLAAQRGQAAPKAPELEAAEAAAGRPLRRDERIALFGPKLLRAESYWDHEDIDVTGWWISEKYDGLRAKWTGTGFLSREGNTFNAPAFFTAGFPSHPIDGELWLGRGRFQEALSVVRSGSATEATSKAWERVQYMCFDMPHMEATPFEVRHAMLQQAVDSVPYAFAIRQVRCSGKDDMLAALDGIILLGGEGIVLREPGSLYVGGSSTTALKVKRFKDAEAVVLGYTAGTGKHKGKTGAIIVRLENGEECKLNVPRDADRVNPPAIGATVTYSYTGTTDRGAPRDAAFVAPRDGY